MTYTELYKMCLLAVRKHNVGTVTPADFCRWINKAQTVVYDNKLAMMDSLRRPTEDLIPFHKSSVACNIIEGNKFKLPADFHRMSSVELDLSISGVTYEKVPMAYLRDSRVSKVLNSAYGKPSKKQCYYTYISMSEGQVLCKLHIPAGSAPTVKVSYYGSPITITELMVTSADPVQWGDSVINEIVDQFTLMYLANVGDPRIQGAIAVKNQTNTTN